MGIKIVKKTITPDLALQFLLFNHPNNRKIRYAKVDKFAEDIADGKWKLTHQAIGFDGEGQLIDGQHRLHAIVQANRPIEMFVAYGLQNDVFSAIDTGTPRSTSDAAAIAGIALSPSSLATLRWFLAKEGNTKSISHSAAIEQYLLWQEIIGKVHEMVDGPRNGSPHWNTGPVRGAIARAILHLGDETVSEFVRRLRMMEFGANCPVKALYNYSAKNRDQGYEARKLLFFRAQRAIKAFADSEALTCLKQSTEVFELIGV